MRKAQQTQGDLQALIIQNPEGNEQRDPIFVQFMKDDENKIDKDYVSKVVGFMDEWSKKITDTNTSPLVNTILIVKSGATSIARKSLNEIMPFRIEIFS